MRDTLNDIREKLKSRTYKNEEHVRLSLVARLLLKLGWNVWDPNEVNSEFNTAPSEDTTKVDIALFLSPHKPDIFIEIKSVGKISQDLSKWERQLRNYNRDNTALFSILTDGRLWRFYFSQTGGTFSQKRFKTIDILSGDLDDIEQSFYTFLQKSEIDNGNAKKKAEIYIRLNEKQRIAKDLLPQASRNVLEPPYPSLPEALMNLMDKKNCPINKNEAEKFIAEEKFITGIESVPNISNIPGTDEPDIDINNPIKSFPPENPPDLRFASVQEAIIGLHSAKNWNALLRNGVMIALQNKVSLNSIQKLSIPIEEGKINKKGFHPVKGFNFSVQGLESIKAWELALALAKELKCKIMVKFKWRDNKDVGHSGEEGLLHWEP